MKLITLAIALLLAQRLPPVRSTSGGGGSLNGNSWTDSLPQPTIPTVPNPGDSFTSAFGYRVVRITSAATDGGSSFKCVYVSPSCLNRDNSKIMAYNGSWRVIPLNSNLTPVNSGYSLDSTPGFPGGLQVGFWSRNPATPNRYYVSQGIRLYRFEAGATASTSSWTLIKDFTGAWSGNGSCSIPGANEMISLSPDEDTFYFDNREQSKYTCGSVVYSHSTNTTRWMPGRVYTNTTPTFDLNKFVGIGMGMVTKNGQWVGMQANLCLPGGPLGIFVQPGCTGNVGTDPTSKTYAVASSSSNYTDGGVSLTGGGAVYHGAATNAGNIHIASSSNYQGFLPNGNPNYYNYLKWHQDFGSRPLDALGNIPYVVIGGWPNAVAPTGLHMSNNRVGSDTDIIISVYDEAPPRRNGALSNVISSVSTAGRYLLSNANYEGNLNVTVTQQGIIQHLTHHYSYPECVPAQDNYIYQPQASQSMDGKRVAFTSTFGGCGSSARYDIFIIDIP